MNRKARGWVAKMAGVGFIRAQSMAIGPSARPVNAPYPIMAKLRAT